MEEGRMNGRDDSRLMIVALFGSLFCAAGCVSKYDSLFGTNYELRHADFVKLLDWWIGKPFNHVCLTSKQQPCIRSELPSGLSRYEPTNTLYSTLGCHYWYDVNPQTRMVEAVGFEGGEKQCIALD